MAAKRKYRWEEWLQRLEDGYGLRLESGVDYYCSQSTMVQMIRNNASLRRLRVRLTDMGDSIIIEVTGAAVIASPEPSL